jgi:hypothetical protein
MRNDVSAISSDTDVSSQTQLTAVTILEVTHRIEVAPSYDLWDCYDFVLRFHIAKACHLIERKPDLGRVQHVENDHLTAAVTEVLQAFEHVFGLIE